MGFSRHHQINDLPGVLINQSEESLIINSYMIMIAFNFNVFLEKISPFLGEIMTFSRLAILMAIMCIVSTHILD